MLTGTLARALVDPRVEYYLAVTADERLAGLSGWPAAGSRLRSSVMPWWRMSGAEATVPMRRARCSPTGSSTSDLHRVSAAVGRAALTPSRDLNR